MLYPKYYHNSIIFLLKHNQINLLPYKNTTCTEKYQKVIKSVLQVQELRMAQFLKYKAKINIGKLKSKIETQMNNWMSSIKMYM